MCAHICARARVLQKKAAGPLKAKMESYRAAVWASSVSFPALLSLFLSLSLILSLSRSASLFWQRSFKSEPEPTSSGHAHTCTYFHTHTHTLLRLSLSLSLPVHARPLLQMQWGHCWTTSVQNKTCHLLLRARTQTHARTRTLCDIHMWHMLICQWQQLTRSLTLSLCECTSLALSRSLARSLSVSQSHLLSCFWSPCASRLQEQQEEEVKEEEKVEGWSSSSRSWGSLVLGQQLCIWTRSVGGG